MFIVGTRRSETGPNLAGHLRDCEAGYEIPEGQDYIVNYGRHGMRNVANLNARVGGNKLDQLQRLMAAGIKVPNIYIIGRNVTPDYFPRHYYPLLARKIKHSQGRDIIFLRSRRSWLKRRRRVAKRQFCVKYIPKQEEFRVHITKDKLICVSQKIKHPDCSNPHPHIWSREKGWIQIDYDGTYTETLNSIGKKVIQSLDLDFGAIDIILGEDGEFYVLEVNTAPRLNRRRRILYAKFFRKMWKNWKRGNRRNR